MDINGGMKGSKVSPSPAADRTRQRGDAATMFGVPREVPRMRRGAKTRRPSSRVRGAAASLPASGNFLAELSSFIPLSSSKNNRRGGGVDHSPGMF